MILEHKKTVFFFYSGKNKIISGPHPISGNSLNIKAPYMLRAYQQKIPLVPLFVVLKSLFFLGTPCP